MINQVLILAAGRGSRMRPLTDKIPKPLIKVNNKSMLDRVLFKLSNIPSIDKIIVNGFYLSDKIEEHLKSLNNNKIIFSKEDKILETGGGLVNALPLFDENKPILIINGDIVWKDNSAISYLIESFNDVDTDILIGLKDKDSFLGYDGKGDFNLNEDGGVSRGDINDFVYTGIQIFHPRILKDGNFPQEPFSLSYFFKDIKRKSVRLKAIKLPGKFFHIGTPKALEQYGHLVDQ